jgi:hypothetical protein
MAPRPRRRSSLASLRRRARRRWPSAGVPREAHARTHTDGRRGPDDPRAPPHRAMHVPPRTDAPEPHNGSTQPSLAANTQEPLPGQAPTAPPGRGGSGKERRRPGNLSFRTRRTARTNPADGYKRGSGIHATCRSVVWTLQAEPRRRAGTQPSSRHLAETRNRGPGGQPIAPRGILGTPRASPKAPD